MDNSKPSTIQRLPAAFRPLAFVLVAVAVSFLFPADLRFKYQYEKQQTWRYEDLEAPFDFAIRKTEEELANERQEVVQHSAPVFVLDPDIAKERKVAFSDQFQQQLEQAKKSAQFRDVPLHAQKYLNYGLAFLDRIFQRGIIKLDGNQKNIAQGEVITVLRGNTYQDQTLENVLNLKAAIELITDSLPYSSLSEPEFLLPLLQDQLQANIFYSRDRTQQILDDALGKIVTSRGLVQKGK